MAWGLDAPDTPGAPTRCRCCGSATSMLGAPTGICPPCDLVPDPLQEPWAGWLLKWAREIGSDGGPR